MPEHLTSVIGSPNILARVSVWYLPGRVTLWRIASSTPVWSKSQYFQIFNTFGMHQFNYHLERWTYITFNIDSTAAVALFLHVQKQKNRTWMQVQGCQNKPATGAFHRLFWILRRLLRMLVGQFWAWYWRNKMEIATYFLDGTSYSNTYWQPCKYPLIWIICFWSVKCINHSANMLQTLLPNYLL